MDEHEFSMRVMRSRDKLFRIAYTILRSEPDCADAVQETLLRAWQNLGKLREEQYFDTWLVRILINECKRLCTARRRPQAMYAPSCPPENPELHDALMRLDKKYRLPLTLHYMEGYALKEVAHLLRLPMGTVKSRMHAGRERLRAELEAKEES